MKAHLLQIEIVTATLCFVFGGHVVAQQPNREASPQSGKTLYETACAACHGATGKGQPKSQVGFDVPVPDFTDCSFATREPDEDWLGIAHSGGPIRGFDQMMPAFGAALSEGELQRILEHIRTFCTDRSWPRGELNLPRALFTEKAYPEDEAVVTVTAASEGRTSATSEFIWERRIGARSQLELTLPFAIRAGAGPGTTDSGIGDIAIGLKHVLFHSLESGSIFSVGGEVVLPTGDDRRGLGTGTTILEPFVLYGKILPAAAFFQLHVLADFPTEPGFEDELAWRAAIGRTWTSGGRFGRAWTPMIEVLNVRSLNGDGKTDWDAVPQLQVTLNQRQHIMANVGMRVPLTDASTRDTEVSLYVLWDWYDGGLLDGW